MSIDSYSSLRTAIANWLHRSDLADRAPEFIALVEAQMNRRLRVRRMIQRSTATIDTEYSALPSDFLGVKVLVVDGIELKFLTPDQMAMAVMAAATWQTSYYTIEGGEFRYYPAPTDSVTAALTYWKAIPALSDANTSNWVLANHPDAYLYGALTQAAPYLKDDARLAVWAGLYERVLSDIEAADRPESEGLLTPLPNGYAY